jgi:hypothetical protein
MKWFFIVLLAINIILAGFQWLQHREAKVAPVYQSLSDESSIVLLSELSDSPENGRGDEERCLLIGPSAKKEGIELGLSALGLDKSDARLIEQGIEKAPSYWVYIKFSDNVASVLSRLQQDGVDAYQISSGELKGGVSLGVFENIDLARRLVKKINKKGYEAAIYSLERKTAEYWLLLRKKYAADNQGKINEFLASLLKNAEKREIFCKSVASEK